MTWNAIGGLTGLTSAARETPGRGQYWRPDIDAAETDRAPRTSNNRARPRWCKYSECMRANGVPDFPDPREDGTTNFNGTGGSNPNNPSGPERHQSVRQADQSPA